MLLEYCTQPARVLKRPSSRIKSPYVADIQFKDEIQEYLAHTPGLHLGGQIVTNSEVFVSENAQGKTDYKIICVKINEIYVCAQPLYANFIFEKAFHEKLLPEFASCSKLQREVRLEKDHRIDFVIDETYYVEVKCVVCKQDNTAIFPVGGTPKKIIVGDKTVKTISPRAIKHIQKLNCIPNSFIFFVILRNDCTSMRPNQETDPCFAQTLKESSISLRAFDANVSKEGISFGKYVPVDIS